MKLALVTLPDLGIWTPDSLWSNLHYWWEPPSFVTQFWANACYIKYTDNEDHASKVLQVRESYTESVKSFWRLMVL